VAAVSRSLDPKPIWGIFAARQSFAAGDLQAQKALTGPKGFRARRPV